MSSIGLNSKVSVIIVNYKSWQHLRNCLNALRFEPSQFLKEIIVVDNCSNDGKLEEFKTGYPDVQFILNTGNNGFANANNLGAKEASGDYFLFLNPDTLVNQVAIEKMLFLLKSDATIGIVSCLHKKPKGGFEKSQRSFPKLLTLFGLTRAVYRLLQNDVAKREKAEMITDWVSGSLIFMRRNWFEQIGGWNEDYWMYYEDIDICKRVSNANGKVVVFKDVSIIHNHGGSSRINLKTATITKTEVLISKHVYIQNHFKGVEKFLAHLILTKVNIVLRFILALLGFLLFPLPKMRLNVYLWLKMISYYYSVLMRRSWLSKRSMNYNSG